MLAQQRPRSAAREAPWAEAEAVIARRFAQEAVIGVPIYLQLQNTLLHLAREQILSGESQLPPDQRLSSLLGISLGTVQKALGNLALQGWVRREHGRGTFIAVPRQPVEGLWHFRFRDPETGAPLPVYAKLLRREAAAGSAMLRRRLGDDPAGFVEIERLISVDGRFSCHSRFFLGATRFGRILELPRAAVEDVNLKALLATEFAAPTLSVEELAHAMALDAELAAHLDAERGAPALRLEVLARTTGHAALSFQVIHVPMTSCPLDLSPLRGPAEAR